MRLLCRYRATRWLPRRGLSLLGVLLAMMLTSCVPSAPVPAYLALLTPMWPGIPGSCTGFVVSPREVMTAGHCAENQRIVTTTGQVAWVASAYTSPDHDVAVLVTDRVLWVSDFAELGHPALGKSASLWGYCPFQVGYVERRAIYNGLVDATIQGMPERTLGEWIFPVLPGVDNEVCPGDSGSPIVQGGKVVGIVSGGHIPVFFLQLADVVFTVPTEYGAALLDASRGGD